MCARYIANQHKHPQTQTHTHSPQFIQYRNDYIAWAVKILDDQRQTLTGHLQRVHTGLPWSGGTGEQSAHVHEPAPSSFTPPKIKRYFG